MLYMYYDPQTKSAISTMSYGRKLQYYIPPKMAFI